MTRFVDDRSRIRCILAALFAAATLAPTSAQATDAAPPHWVATWTAAPQPDFPGPHARFDHRTIRLVVRSSIGGARARVTLSNRYGDVPLVVADAHLARIAQGVDTDPATDVALRFGGRAAVVVPPHGSVTSDAADVAVPPLAELAVSLHFGATAVASTTHALTLSTGAQSAARADVAAQAHWSRSKPLDAWPFVTGLDVDAPADAAAVVAIGDSTVDGDGVTPGTHHRWTERLAERLQQAGGAAADVAVVNEGIIGNRLLAGSPGGKDFGAGLGEAALARLDRDALQRPGVRALIVRIGVNDLGFAGGLAPREAVPTADDVVAGLRALVARAHACGVRVIGATLTPFEGVTALPGYFSPAKEAVRQQVNARLRAGGVFDALVDADALLRDPARPSRLRADLDHGDHLHPNDDGNAVLADAIPLAWFADAGVR